MIWAMQRMKIPNIFTRLILSLLTKTTAQAQTASGLSPDLIRPQKGLPQGDPIAPILFDVVIDALFDIMVMKSSP